MQSHYRQFIAKEGFPSIAISLVCFLLACFLSFGLALALFCVLIACIFCFYIPKQAPTQTNNHLIIAPLDGKIKQIHTQSHQILIIIEKTLWHKGILKMPINGEISLQQKRHGLANAHPITGQKMSIDFIQNNHHLHMALFPKYFKTLSLYFEKSTLPISKQIGFLLCGQCHLSLPLGTKLNIMLDDEINAGKNIIGYLS